MTGVRVKVRVGMGRRLLVICKNKTPKSAKKQQKIVMHLVLYLVGFVLHGIGASQSLLETNKLCGHKLRHRDTTVYLVHCYIIVRRVDYAMPCR